MRKRLFAGLLTTALLPLISLPTQVCAQTSAASTRVSEPFRYKISEEVTLQGTVSAALAKPAPGMMMGSHLLLATPSGQVDASLARFQLSRESTAAMALGQSIEVTGVRRTIKNQQVFVVRTMKAAGQIYTIRNEHGFPVRSQGREQVSRKAAGEGL